MSLVDLAVVQIGGSVSALPGLGLTQRGVEGIGLIWADLPAGLCGLLPGIAGCR
jgi:hypothetical protein